MTHEPTSTGKDLERYAGPPKAEQEMLGELAIRDLSPEVRQETQWTAPENGLQKQLAGVHLGNQLGPDGWSAGHKDRSETVVADAGITFVVSQASHGPTFVDAKALPGYKVEAAALDDETGHITWEKPRDEEGEVRIASDRGNMMDTPFEDWATANLGNPGARAGVVRVTDPENHTKYYALGAQFEGEPDNWQVLGGIIEVQPQPAQALPGTRGELPPAR